MSLEDPQRRLDEERGHLQEFAADVNSLPGNNVDGSSGNRARSETIEKLQYFKLIRAYRLAEQNLLNHRLTWNLALQGFLFATYGITLQKLAELESGESMADITKPELAHILTNIHLLLMALPWMVFWLSVFVLLAVLGAWLALNKLKAAWTSIETKQPKPYIPNPAGGGSKAATYLGLIPPVFIPLGFAAAWLIILIKG